MLDILYNGNQFKYGFLALGDKYNPPEKFKHGENTLVATLQSDSDGQDVELYECRLPANFFIIKVLPTLNSINEMKEGYEITTGSGMAQLACNIAKAVSEGMIDFHKNKE